jgi:putative holliday junction resolvase
MRILAVDPGEKNLGIAISDPTGTIANPLTVLKHVSRPLDAAAIARLAADNQAERIIVGQALDEDGQPTPRGPACGSPGGSPQGSNRPPRRAVGRKR